jgi:hypothetical protein
MQTFELTLPHADPSLALTILAPNGDREIFRIYTDRDHRIECANRLHADQPNARIFLHDDRLAA